MFIIMLIISRKYSNFYIIILCLFNIVLIVFDKQKEKDRIIQIIM